MNLQELRPIPPVIGMEAGVSKPLGCYRNLNEREREVKESSVWV